MAKKNGRPRSQTTAITALILSRIADGESLRTICSEPGLPTIQTVRNWIIYDASFFEQYARARAEQADTYADEIVHISDTEADPHKARNRIEARKWVASKLLPKKWGDNQPALTINNNVQVVITEDKRQELIQRRQRLLQAQIIQPALTQGDTE